MADRLPVRSSVSGSGALQVESLVHKLARRAYLETIKALRRSATVPGPSPITVVIAVGPKDADIVDLTVQGVSRNLLDPVDVLMLVAPEAIFEQLRERFPSAAVVRDQEVLGRSLWNELRDLPTRNHPGWLIQQFVKLRAAERAETKFTLLIDADTVLVRPQSFFHKERPTMLCGDGYHVSYFIFLECLLGKRLKPRLHSCVTHHMLFESVVLRDLLDELGQGSAGWERALLEALRGGCPGMLSEYEMYGHWALSSVGKVRREYWRNRAVQRGSPYDIRRLEALYGNRFRSVSLHHYL